MRLNLWCQGILAIVIGFNVVLAAVPAKCRANCGDQFYVECQAASCCAIDGQGCCTASGCQWCPEFVGPIDCEVE
jgi:hypothetical protein